MLFTSDSSVIDIGMRMLRFIVPFYITYIAIEILAGACRGLGKTFIPTLMTLFGVCVLRVLWLRIVADMNGTLEAVAACYPVTWIFTSILFVIYYRFGKLLPSQREDDSLHQSA